jgi:hypothetical protein
VTAPGRPIAALQGASTLEIQALMRDFVEGLPASVRIAGVVEEPVADDDAQLRNLRGGECYPVFQDLGPSSIACAVDAASVVGACEAVRRDIVAGCDLVVLSKFGRLEAERSGLEAAFAAAVDQETPILTSVAPRFAEAWTAFAAPLFVILPPEMTALRLWWRSLAPSQARASADAA